MKRLLSAVLLAAFASTAPAVGAEQIKLVVPFAAGGPVDLVARTVAVELGPRLGADLIVDNRGGAGGVIGTEFAAKSPPDGRTLLMASLGSHVLAAALRPQLNYDPIKSFVPIAHVGAVPLLLVVGTQSRIASLSELITAAKRTTMSYGSAGPGSAMHIAAEVFNSAAGVKTTHGPALADLLGGHVDIILADAPVLVPMVNSHAVRALALFARERSPLVPDIPTAGELGYPDMVMENWYGVLAPAGMAAPLRATFEKAVLDVLTIPVVKERLAQGGLQGGGGSEAFAAKLAADVAYWGPTVKRLGITAE
jgi:tripartite-type tricarboxylate transporter receptor subunit TctC